MAGRKKAGNANRKAKFKARRENNTPQKNKERKWKAMVRKLERKGHKHRWPSLEAEQNASKKAS